MNCLGIFYGHSLLTAEKIAKVEQLCKEIHCSYSSPDWKKSYVETYVRDPVSGLWDWTKEVYNEDLPVDNTDRLIDESFEPIKVVHHRPTLDTGTVIEYVRDSVQYCDGLVEVDD